MERIRTDTDEAPQDDEQRLDILDEVLVEEVSIDGMCGVY